MLHTKIEIPKELLYSWLKTLPRKIFLLFTLGFSFFLLSYSFEYVMHESISFQKSSFYFSSFYILLFTILCYLLPKKVSRYVYTILYFFFFIVGIIQIFYYKSLYLPFGINDLFYAKEGHHYFYTLFSYIDYRFLIYFFLSIFCYIFNFYLLTKQPKNIYVFDQYLFSIVLLIFCFYSSYCAQWELGSVSIGDTTYRTTNNPRYIYEQFTNRLDAFSITGLFEYTVRDIFLYLKETWSYDYRESITEIDAYLASHHRNLEENEYTGLLKNQNLIVILLESVDNWLITSDIMPTLSYLKETGMNFSNRYAPAFGGGRTFNTEYALNTGLYIPLNHYNIYDSVQNFYPQSLANQFRKNGYLATSIHMNHGTFYARSQMHKTFGYEHHYALRDLELEGFEDDRMLIENEQVSSWIVPKEEPFLSYVITYSVHLPYTQNNLCQSQNEDTCIRELAYITDTFLKNLLLLLENEGKLENTTLALISDHYAYGYLDIDTLLGYKQVTSETEKEIEKVPFIIWNQNMKPQTVETILGTNDILPTLLNLYGFSYNPNQYIGNDVFSSYKSLFTYFNDYTWISNQDRDFSMEVREKIEMNDKIIKTNYFRRN